MKKLIAVLASTVAIHLAPTVSAVPFINNAPTILPIADQTIFENSILSLPFTVDDVDTGDLALLVVTASSSNPALLPDGNLILSGIGNDRTLTAVPLADETGFTMITLTAIDPFPFSTVKTFRLTVLPPIATVPDSGSSMMLAGLAFAGMLAFRRDSPTSSLRSSS